MMVSQLHILPCQFLSIIEWKVLFPLFWAL